MSEQAQTIPNKHRTASYVVLILDVLAGLLVLFSITSLAAKFGSIFSDLLEGQPLPALTRAFLSVPKAAAAALFGAAAAVLIYKEVRCGNRTTNLIINGVVLALLMLVFMAFLVAMYLPLTEVITSLKK